MHTRSALPHSARLLLAFLAALIALLTLAPATSSVAVATPEPNTGPVFSIAGRLVDNGNPVAGVSITVTGADAFEEESETSDDGRWEVEVPTVGEYEVELDESTLPDGVALRDSDANPNPATVSVASTSSTTTYSFRLGERTSSAANLLDTVIVRLVAGLLYGLLIALAAVGLSLIFGTTGLNNFAHGEMVTFGAVTAWFLSQVVNLPFLLAATLAIVLTAGVGWLQDAAIWKPLRRRGLNLVSMMIVSIGLGIAARYTVQLIYGGRTQTLPVSQTDNFTIGPVTMATSSYLTMLISVVVLVGVALFLSRTRLGKATRAVSDNSALAAASGIDVDRVIRFVWIAGGALAGLAGILLGIYRGASWDMGFQLLLLLFAAVTLGGLGTAYGALIGSLIIGMFVELSTLVIPADLRNAGALVILILVLLVRPQGVLGRKSRIG